MLSPIPTSFYITVALWCEKDAGIRLKVFISLYISGIRRSKCV